MKKNWIPGQGEDLHIAIWPGGIHNTRDITRFIAMEARSYVVSASGLMRKTDFPPDTPNLEAILMERQNFDPAGHYARPDVTQLTVNRQRQNTLKIVD